MTAAPAIDPAWRPDIPWGDRPWTIHQGDNRCALDAYDPESFDLCVTDCPYGLSTELDPPNLERVQRWLDIATGEDPGPVAELLGEWLRTGENPRVTGKGFMGNEWDALVPCPNAWRAAWRVLKPGAYLLTFAGSRTHDLVSMSVRLAHFRVEDTISWLTGQGMPKRRRLDLAIDTHLGAKDKRPVIRPRPQPSSTKDIYGAMAPRDEQMETSAATPEAARHVGWDRGLRPGHEPIVVASKPMRGTVAETALRYGTGGMHVDACRIPRGDAGVEVRVRGQSIDTDIVYGQYADRSGQTVAIDARGGYPANVIIDEEVAADLDARHGMRKAGAPRFERGTGGIWTPGNGIPCGPQYGDEGGASRYFYTAKASTSERDAGLDAMAVMSPGERSGRVDGSDGINGYAGTRGEARNPHPTVKPVEAMRECVREALYRYIARLGSPPGAWHEDVKMRPVVLDPFAGSGSTGVACMREGLRFVGCELGERYAEVARARLQHAYALPRESGERVGGGDGRGDGEGSACGVVGQQPLF